MIIYKIPTTIKQVFNPGSPPFPPSRMVNPTLNPTPSTTVDGGNALTITVGGLNNIITPAGRDVTLDLTFDCSLRDSSGDLDRGVLIAAPTLLGDWISIAHVASALTASVTLHGEYRQGIIANGLFEITLSLKPDDAYFASAVKENWIKWSNIGSLDFTVWKDNIAGERPLDWKGLIYSVKKLGNKVVAYGENGVSILIPAGNTYGLQTVHRAGLKGKQSVAGDDSVQFFVDTAGQLFLLGEMAMKSSLFEASMHPVKLDYSEYLSGMSDLVLSWDAENKLLYICDGTKGYVYSPEDGSLGSGPVNITGIASQGGTLYATAPADITIPVFEICTDIYDFGTNKYKTIHEIGFGTNVTGTLQAAIDYRDDISADFLQTNWENVSSRGNAFITALGREFRFRAKIGTYEYFELDYITTRGIVHDH